MYIDPSPMTVLAVCDQCDWRANRPTSAAAWTSLALHVKNVHGETSAVGRVRSAARMARRRERRRDQRQQETVTG